jgi:orotidine-5'-phosphate decarboxylase
MTPGVHLNCKTSKDQNYSNPEELDTDIIIVGRGIYNSSNIEAQAKIYSQIKSN